MESDQFFTSEETERLDAWLREHVTELGDGPLDMRFITGGSSNVVMRLSRGGRPLVLRKAPTLAPPASAKAIQREATVLRGLRGSDVPHPRFFGYCGDAAVAGGPFYVMDLVDGWAADLSVQNQMSFQPPFDDGPDRHHLAYAMVDGIARMANFDYVAAGLQDYGKPDNFLGRQVDRWGSQLASYPQRYPGFESRALPGLDYVADWLRDNVPSTGRPGLMHGDYAMNNVMFAHRPPARLAAIIDWETSTIGDPLMDLASYGSQLRRRAGPQPEHPYIEPEHFPFFEDVVDWFADVTGRDVSAIDYYMILSKYRMACICEYKVAEAAVGLAPPEKGARFDGIVRGLLSEAQTLARAAG